MCACLTAVPCRKVRSLSLRARLALEEHLTVGRVLQVLLYELQGILVLASRLQQHLL